MGEVPPVAVRHPHGLRDARRLQLVVELLGPALRLQVLLDAVVDAPPLSLSAVGQLVDRGAAEAQLVDGEEPVKAHVVGGVLDLRPCALHAPQALAPRNLLDALNVREVESLLDAAGQLHRRELLLVVGGDHRHHRVCVRLALAHQCVGALCSQNLHGAVAALAVHDGVDASLLRHDDGDVWLAVLEAVRERLDVAEVLARVALAGEHVLQADFLQLHTFPSMYWAYGFSVMQGNERPLASLLLNPF